LVELFEYILALTTTALFAVAGIAVLSQFLPVQKQTSLASSFSVLSSSARYAVAENTDVKVVVVFQNASLSCGQGVLTLSSVGNSYSSPVGGSCSFSFPNLTGSFAVKLTGESGVLHAELT
jgi:hypothetical protein